MDMIPPGTDLNLVPAGMPPPGVMPIIGGGPSLGTTTIVLEGVMMGIAVCAVALRLAASFHSRGKASGGFTAADYASLFAIVVAIGQSVIIISMHDYSRHQWNISVGMMTASYFKRIWAQYFIAWPSIFAAKVSILLFYLHLFRIKPAMRWAAWAGIVWAALTYIPNMVVSTYFCAPHVGEGWTFLIGERCGTKGALKWLVCSAAMSVALDVYIFLLPIPVISGLRLSGKKKFGVFLVFFTAVFALVCAVLTLVYRIKLMQTTDSMWLSAQLFICNGVENYIAIIVGAMPGCSSYFKSHIMGSSLFSSLASRFTGSRSGGSQPSGFGASSKGTYKLKDISDAESQKSLRPEGNDVVVKQSYSVSYN